MSFTKTQIAQRALTNIGVTTELTDVDTDTSTEAEHIARNYDLDRDAVLRDFPWPFARTYLEPTLAYGDDDEAANGDWQYAYRLPDACLAVRRIVTVDDRSETIPAEFEIGRDPDVAGAAAWSGATAYVYGDLVSRLSIIYQCILAHTNQQPPSATYWVVVANDKLLFTDQEDAEIEYTAQITDTTEFTVDFIEALAWKIAASIAPPLTRMTDMLKTALAVYGGYITRAKTAALNETQREKPREAEWISGRD
jgi:hypothetical protein